jgi:hypothetical protein
MNNEERIEEILYQAHSRGDFEKLLELVVESEKNYPDKRRIDHYEFAHFRIRTSYMLK